MPSALSETPDLYGRLIPEPVHETIADAKTLYIVPTGPLYLLPFETLVTNAQPLTHRLKQRLRKSIVSLYFPRETLAEFMKKFEALVTNAEPLAQRIKRRFKKSVASYFTRVETNPPRYLIEDHAVTYLSSASLLKLLKEARVRRREQPEYPLLAFADPVYEPAESSAGDGTGGGSPETPTGPATAAGSEKTPG